MASVIRAFGFSNSLQQLIWPITTSQITAYVWGGGGGGGGNERQQSGGNGGGAGFARKTFTINNGDTLQVAVAGAGGAGATNSSGAPGGSAGSSYTANTIWTSLELLSNPINLRVTNGTHVGFLNQYGVWNYTPSATYFDQTVTVNFPSSDYYNITGSCNDYATIYIDGASVLDISGFQTTYNSSVYVTAGNHSLRLYGVNTGYPGSIGLNITSGSSFGGGNGSAAGTGGVDGGGGGGGGASVILLNGTPIAIAGGGGGGGGAGNDDGGGRGNAPGPSGQTSTGIYAGQNGEPKGGDNGGGAGGGGGGYAGGNGGSNGSGGDYTGYAGYYGSSLGDVVDNPSGRTPGGTNQPYYSGSVGYGGVNTKGGSSGYVVLDMAVGGGASVKFNGNWESVQRTYIKTNGVWQPVQATYVKDNGTWSPISGSFAPTFTTVVGNWGSDPRSY